MKFKIITKICLLIFLHIILFFVTFYLSILNFFFMEKNGNL